jgi:hypothetical protein
MKTWNVICSVSTAFILTGCSGGNKVSLDVERDEILPNFFTSEALVTIGDVPMYSGSIDGWALSVGDDWGSNLLSIVYGYGAGRQVLLPYSPDQPRDSWVDLLTFHEYIHQVDYDGLLSRTLFSSRLARMHNDPDFAYVADALERYLDSLSYTRLSAVANAYDDARAREGMAYLIQFWADACFDLPDYMMEVYEGVVVPNPASRLDKDGYCLYFWEPEA